MKYQVVLWDFDGTLVDTSAGIFQSLGAAFDRLGMPLPEQEVLNRFMGPPLMFSFRKFLGLTEEESWRAVLAYREDYTSTGIYNSKVYDGLPGLIARLKENGALCGVATLKPERMARELLAYFGIAHLFDACAGNGVNEPGDSTKAQMIARALEQMGWKGTDGVVLIGDTIYDYEGAREAGVDFIGASYGFGLAYGDGAEMMPGCTFAADAAALEKLLL